MIRTPNNGLMAKNNMSSLNHRLRNLAKAIKQLTMIESADASHESKEFKKKQLKSLLLGNNLQIESLRGDELASSFLKLSTVDDHSHLGIINLKNIGCDYEGLSHDSEISVLDVHNKNPPYCEACVNSSDKKLNFSKGIINPYNCWRRGHSSAKFGFLSSYELNITSGGTLLSHLGTKSSKELKSIFYGIDSKNSQLEVGESSIGSNMIVSIKINSNRNVESSKLSEVKGVLNQQLLVSTNLSKTISQSEDSNKRDHRDKIPEYIGNILNQINNRWHLDGPSMNSKGIIGIALINNKNKYAESSIFQNVLQSFATKNSIWYDFYELGQVSQKIRRDYDFSNFKIPNKCSVLCIILDPIIDLGGGDILG